MELLALTGGGVHAAVVDAGAGDLDLPPTGGDRPGWGVAVAAYQPVAVLGGLVGVGGQEASTSVSNAAASILRAPSRASSSRLIVSSLWAGSSATTLNIAAFLPRRR